MPTMNKARRALIAGSARLHENSLTEYGSGVARPCVEVAVRELIDRCNGSVRFSIKVVCARLHLSQSQMSQKFKSRYHKTILEYWSQVRLNRARALLSESPVRSVDSIAMGAPVGRGCRAAAAAQILQAHRPGKIHSRSLTQTLSPAPTSHLHRGG